MIYCNRRIPVLFIVLVFLFWLNGCKSEKEIVDLSALEAEAVSDSEGAQEELGRAEEEFAQKEPDQSLAEQEEPACVVHICGAVNRPGVYALPEGSRVCDAVEAAGGLSEEASGSSVNQAERLVDGMRIVVPTQEEAALFPSGSGSGSSAGLVNINTASREELMQLPGIGETRAEAILNYRQEQGRFQTIEDIMKVDGIKEASFEKLKELITV